MEKLLINGGKQLYGEVTIPTAKNAVLPIIAGCVLVDGVVEICNYPKFTDVYKMLDIVRDLGAKITLTDSSIFLDCSTIDKSVIMLELAKDLRSSMFTVGALVSRFKEAKVAYPGGCEIGARPIDLHLRGLEALGVRVVDKHGYIYCHGENIHAGDYHLDFPSVGATENIMMASCILNGVSKLYNCAKEPEITDLQDFLNACGANIQGAGTDTITIIGSGKLLHGCKYKPICDRIIAGTYAIATAVNGGQVTLNNVNCVHIFSLLYKLQAMGCFVECKDNKVIIASSGRLNAIPKIETMPYPGFPTDLQPQMMLLECISSGNSIIVENLFEARFKQVPELVRMGANITVQGKSAIICGVPNLYGAEVCASDLRAGACLVLAGLFAKGYTKISNINYIDRGYYKIEEDLKTLGADIKRIEE